MSAANSRTDRPTEGRGTELDGTLRAQNRDQARDNVVKLAELGLRVAPGRTDASGAPHLTEVQVTAMARAEHDRWARQKYLQGFHNRGDPGGDRHHPDLVAWDRLDDAARRKDEEPVGRIPAVLAAAGLVIVDGGQAG